jgi:ParB-like chromosome segregation protein Spo0J
MSNPFGAGGEFSANIRAIGGDDTELRESLKAFGWVPEFPALVDENGVVLVGNRRVKIAKELGIEPVLETVNCGNGSEADARRFKLAIASNIGHQAMTAVDRKRIAQHLYGKQEWTMQRIAEALGTTHKTISKDLNEFVPLVQIKSHPKTTSNPKGAGRPRGMLKPERRMNTKPDAEAAARAILDNGKTYAEMEAATGLSGTVLRSAIAREEGRREALADPVIRPEDLTLSARQKLEVAIRQHKKKLDLEFEESVRQKVLSRTKDRFEWMKKKEDWANRIIGSHKGIFSRQDYRKILACLHPDHNSFQFAAEALQAFSKQEKVLVKPEPPALDPRTPPLPRTAADWMAARDRATAERRAARARQKAEREARA